MLFIADLENLEWKSIGDLGHYSANIQIGFVRGDQSPVLFDDLSFGYSILHNDQVILENSFPQEGLIYKSSDEEYIVSDVLNSLIPEDMYIIDLWAKDSNNHIVATIEAFAPRLPQPFPSWQYNSESRLWFAPSSPPADGNKYSWNEDLLLWEKI